jgi:hypothetical protein
MRNFIVLAVAVLGIAAGAQAEYANSNSFLANGLLYYTATDKAAYYPGERIRVICGSTNIGTSSVSLFCSNSHTADYGASASGVQVWPEPGGYYLDMIEDCILAPGRSLERWDYWDQKVSTDAYGSPWPVGALVPVTSVEISAKSRYRVGSNNGPWGPNLSVPITICKIGDFDCSGKRDIADTNALWAARTTPGADPRFDLSGNGHVDLADATKLITYYIDTSMSDTDLDHYVGVLDLGALAAKFGQAGGFADGDSDFNGVIDINDLGNMANDFGKHFGTQPIPEPTTLSMLCLMGLASLRRRR